MDSALPDATTSETQLTLMTKRRAFILLMVFLSFTVLFCIVSYAPESSDYREYDPPKPNVLVNKIDFRQMMDGLGSLNQFIILLGRPHFSNKENKRKADISATGIVNLLNKEKVPVGNISVTRSTTVQVAPNSEPHFLIWDKSFIQFSAIDAAITFNTTFQDLASIEVLALALNADVSVSALSCVAIVTFLVALLLFVVIARRVRPSKLDQWMTVILSGTLILVDGPWLVCTYFGLPAFCQVYDVMMQLYHAFFIIYCMIFFSVRTRGSFSRIYKHPVIHICIAVFTILILILALYTADKMPISALCALHTSDAVFIVMLVFFFVYHTGVVSVMVAGLVSLKIERMWNIVLISCLFLIPEALQIIAMIVRCFVDIRHIGSAFGCDLFYILESNLVVFFLLYVDTPLSQNADGSNMFLMDRMIKPSSNAV